MAENTAQEWHSTEPTDDDWSNANSVATESQLLFDTIGDVFIGRFQGIDPPNANGIVQAHFTNADGDFFTNAGRDLQQKLKKVPYGRFVRIEYTDNLNTGQATPMRVYDVKWR